MNRRHLIQSGASAIALTALGRSMAQTFPNGPVTVLMPLQVGTASDVAVRQFVQRMSPKLGAAMVVENVVGAAGLIGMERFSNAKADGQTLAAFNNSILAILPHLQASKIKFDTRTEFLPIVGIANIPTFFGVPKSSAFKDIKEVIAYAKANPDKLTYSSGGIGSPQHLATEMLSAYTGIKLTHVPYKGATQAALGLASGEVDLMSIALSIAQPFLPNERVRLLGYCGAKRHPQFGDVPTLQERGVKDYEYSSWIGLFAHKNTPQATADLLRRHAATAANERELQTQLIASGMEPWVRTPDQLQKIVNEDYARWSSIIKTSKIQSS